MAGYNEMFPEFRNRFEAESHFLHLVAPSVVRPGEPFALRAVMMDARAMPDESYTGVLPLSCDQPGLTFPDALEFGPDDNGAITVEGIVAEKPGGYFLTATPEDCPGQPPRSNPVIVREDGPRLYWGDIHIHTVLGNCHPDTCKSPEFAYWYARNVTLLDFSAVTDHLRGIKRVPGNWEATVRAAREWNAPGDFLTVLAFESSHGREFGGDNNVYFNADEAEHFWVDRDDMWGISPAVGLDTLWSWLDEQGTPYLSIPHHTGRAHKFRDFELDFFDPERERVLEVYSMWGSSEARDDDIFLKGGKTDRRAYWRDALQLGYRYGVIGSSDTHSTMPGNPLPNAPANWWCNQHKLNCQGLAGIWSDELTRDGIFSSLYDRRCFATTWWRPTLELDVSGVRMGCEARADKSMRSARRITARVASSWGGDLVLMRNFEPLERVKLTDTLTECSFVDDQPLEGICITDAPRSPEPFVFYHLQLSGALGQLAWSSPVWLTM